MGKEPEFIIAGVPKSATTWIYECLKEHPEVYMPDTDSVDYFNINYHRGKEWYSSFFEDAESQIIGEETAGYVHRPDIPERIAKDLDDVKIILSLRNPVDRAYSQYWHSYRRGKIDRDFEKIWEKSSMYRTYIYPRFYYKHIQNYLEYFDEDQIKIVFFDDLVEDDEAFIQEIYEFIGADSSYEPSKLQKKVNEAEGKEAKFYVKTKNLAMDLLPGPIIKAFLPLDRPFEYIFADRSEYEKGMSDKIRKDLEKAYRDDIGNLSRYTGRDLSKWLRYEGIDFEKT